MGFSEKMKKIKKQEKKKQVDPILSGSQPSCCLCNAHKLTLLLIEQSQKQTTLTLLCGGCGILQELIIDGSFKTQSLTKVERDYLG